MDVINKIRNILRTEGIAAKKSFNYCVGFIIIRLLDKRICEKLNILYTFDELSNMDKNKLNENIGKLVPQLVYNLNMNFLRNFKLTTDNLYNIFTLLKDLNPHSLNEKYDLIGTIYELHIKSGSNNGRDLGQFFTNRLVIQYMIDLVEPKIDETICDPTMGTGGFLTMCVKYLNNKYNINWSLYKNKIFGYDIDSDIKDLASLNLLLETHEKFGTLYQQDVLSQGLKHKYKIILANEPMGVKTTYNLCCEKIKELGIKGNKCESLFLQLFCQHLDVNGRCCVVVPDGFLSSENHKETRKYIIENFNLKKVISLNGEFFINTNVKTSILYFINNGKTSNVEFCELSSDLKEKTITTFDYNYIVNNNYNFFYSCDLNHKNCNVNYYKIQDVCKILFGHRVTKKDTKNHIYPLYGGGDISYYTDNYNRDGKTLIISRFGVSKKCVRIVEGKIWLNDSGLSLHSNFGGLK
ncbi:MAG: N-6 DNA methylase, partial [Candidatus Micrarchaeaceae archaeon]